MYTVTWAAYFGAIAYVLHLKNDLQNRDSATAVALGFLTIPLAYQGLNDEKYGLMLIFEGIALVLAGMTIRNKLVRTWGAVTLVLSVLYQMRDFLLGLPAWAIFGILGLSLLIGAVILLSKRKD